MKKREEYLDTLRFLAAVWIFTTHFIAFVNYDLFNRFEKMPLYLIFYGITGKLAVTLFCVILGYFSYMKGNSDQGNTLQYMSRRYIYFVIAGFIINSIYAIAAYMGIIDREISIYQVIRSSVLITSDIQARFWCMWSFLIGSFFCYLNGKYKLGLAEIVLETLLFIYCGQIWIAMCLFGNIIILLLENEKIKALFENTWIQILILILIFVFVKRPESTRTYLIDGICSTALIMVVMNNRKLSAALSNKYLAKINKNYMGIYLIHELVYLTLGDFVLYHFINVRFRIRFLLAYILCLVVVIILAYPMDAMVNYCSKYISGFIDKKIFLHGSSQQPEAGKWRSMWKKNI